jgi:hypothetical protein
MLTWLSFNRIWLDKLGHWLSFNRIWLDKLGQLKFNLHQS